MSRSIWAARLTGAVVAAGVVGAGALAGAAALAPSPGRGMFRSGSAVLAASVPGRGMLRSGSAVLAAGVPGRGMLRSGSAVLAASGHLALRGTHWLALAKHPRAPESAARASGTYRGPAGTHWLALAKHPGAPESGAPGPGLGAPLAASPALVAQSPVVFHAPAELEPLALRLRNDPFVWGPLPAIGPIREAVGDTIHIWLVRDLATLAPEGLDRPEDWVAGVAAPAGRRIGLEVGPGIGSLAPLRRVLRHELAHLALHAATGGNAPVWLAEGYAQLAAGEWAADEAWRLRFVFLREGGGLLRGLSLDFPRAEAPARLSYLLSYTAVHALLERGGEPGLRALFARLRAGDELDAAVRRVYGITLGQFETAWREGVADRYGWLYLLSRTALFWLAAALLVFLVWWRRRRRDRARLEALRESERDEWDAGGPDEWDAGVPGERDAWS